MAISSDKLIPLNKIRNENKNIKFSENIIDRLSKSLPISKDKKLWSNFIFALIIFSENDDIAIKYCIQYINRENSKIPEKIARKMIFTLIQLKENIICHLDFVISCLENMGENKNEINKLIGDINEFRYSKEKVTEVTTPSKSVTVEPSDYDSPTNIVNKPLTSSSEDDSSKSSKRERISENEAIDLFFNDKNYIEMTKDPDDCVQYKDLHRCYVKFCDDKRYKAKNFNNFAKYLSSKTHRTKLSNEGRKYMLKKEKQGQGKYYYGVILIQ